MKLTDEGRLHAQPISMGFACPQDALQASCSAWVVLGPKIWEQGGVRDRGACKMCATQSLLGPIAF